MNRNLVSFSVLLGFSLSLASVFAADVPAPAKTETPAAKVEKPKDGGVELQAKKERLLALQNEISALKQQYAQLRDAISKHFISMDTIHADVNAQDQDYILLKQELKQAESKVMELRAKLKQKTDTMPEFKDAADKMAALQGQMLDNSRKLTELLAQTSRLKSEIVVATQKDKPPVKAKEIPPLQAAPAAKLPPAVGK
jgi:chromosome segregation ATPase